MSDNFTRIGIIGADSSHAKAFSGIINRQNENGAYNFANYKVTAIFDDDIEKAKIVAESSNIDFVTNNHLDLIGKIDAVMVVLRDGSLHYKYALPFIEAGVDIWIDKPFTIDFSEAEVLVQAAEKHNVILAGGSTCKYCPDVLHLQKQWTELRSAGDGISAAFNFPGDVNSPYGGIYFYAGHTAEILTTIFGRDVRSIKTDYHAGNVVAIFKYSDFSVTVNFAEVARFYAVFYALKAVSVKEIDISTAYKEGVTAFLTQLKDNRKTHSEILLNPVRILNALDKSIKTGEEIFLSDH